MKKPDRKLLFALALLVAAAMAASAGSHPAMAKGSSVLITTGG